MALWLFSAGFTAAAAAQDEAHPAAPEAEQSWDQCVGALRDDALSQGIPAETVADVFDNVSQLPRVIQADRAQPEFTETFTQYYEKRVTDFRVTHGRNLLASHSPLLARIHSRTGVPPQYLIAFWGLETNFGAYFGKLPIPSALTTLACDSRRGEFFARELLATLRIIANGDIERTELIGSWAGAIGHMQFMPTTFLSYAEDADDDGRRDLIGSIDDALTSGAAYLAAMGWEAGYRWGREVLLPANFDFALAGSEQWRPLADWANMDVKDAFGEPLAHSDIEAALLLPSGHLGPAFLVYPNYRTIMKWNRSAFYALSVGRLADRIAGAGHLSTALPDVRFSTQAMIDLQNGLNQLGFAAGTPDGILGPATRNAIRDFQQRNDQVPDGYPTEALFAAVATQAAVR